MSKKLIGIVVFTCAILISVLVWFLIPSNNAHSKNLNSDWDSSFKSTSTAPYNIQFFEEILKSHVQDSVYHFKSWDEYRNAKSLDSATYFFIGDNFAPLSKQFDSLLRLVDSGSVMYLSFHQISSSIYNYFYQKNALNWDYNRTFFVSLGDTTLPFYQSYQNDTLFHDWYAFEPSNILDSTYNTYMRALKNPMAYYIPSNKGRIHFHAAPELFQNVQVIQNNGFQHTKLILTYIPKNKPVVFMDFAHYSVPNYNENTDGDKNQQDQSLIQYILKIPAFRIAFILLILLMLVFILFRTKRREVILEGYTKSKNSSKPYVETLSSIYLNGETPYSVLQLIRNNFYDTLFKHTFIDLNDVHSFGENKRKLAEKLNFNNDKLTELFSLLKPNRDLKVDENHVARVRMLILELYVSCGFISTEDTNTSLLRKSRFLFHNLWLGSSIIVVGLILLLRGLIWLSTAEGLGVVFLPFALFCVGMGIRYIQRPLLEINEQEITYFGYFFSKKKFNLNQSINIEERAEILILRFEDGSSLNIRHKWLSKESKSQLKRIINFIKTRNK